MNTQAGALVHFFMAQPDRTRSMGLMKNPVLIGIALLTGIAIGMLVNRRDDDYGGGRMAAGNQLPRQPSAREGPRASSGANELLTDYLKGRSPSELTAEEAFQVIETQLKSYPMDWSSDPVERARLNYQFELLASKLPLHVLEEVMDLGRERRANPYMLTQWFGAYVSRDPDRAMEWADRQPDSKDWRGTAIHRLAASDPDLAIKLYKEEMVAGSNRSSLRGVPFQLVKEYGRRGSAALFGLVDSVPSEEKNNLIFGGWEALPEGERGAFLAEIRKRADAGQAEYQYYMNSLTLARAETHPEELRAWMETMPPESLADTALKLAARQIGRGKTEAAKEYLRTAMDAVPETRKEMVNNAASTLYFNNPDLFAMMVEMLPQDEKPTLEDAQKWGAVHGRPLVALDLAVHISSQEDRAAYLANAFASMERRGFRTANAADFEILSKRLEALGLTGEAGEKARAALEGARLKILEQK